MMNVISEIIFPLLSPRICTGENKILSHKFVGCCTRCWGGRSGGVNSLLLFCSATFVAQASFSSGKPGELEIIFSQEICLLVSAKIFPLEIL